MTYFHAKGAATLTLPAGQVHGARDAWARVRAGDEDRRGDGRRDGGGEPASRAPHGPARARLVERRHARAHELRRRVRQRSRAPAGAGGGRGPARRRGPDRQQGAADPRHGAVLAGPRSGLDRDDAGQARRGVPHELVGPHGTPRLEGAPHPSDLRRLRQHRRVRASFPDNSTIIDLAHAQGGDLGLRPPASIRPRPTRPAPTRSRMRCRWTSRSARRTTSRSSASAITRRRPESGTGCLNTGLRLPTGSGTDAMANYASLRGPVGMNRVFARSGAKLDYRAWLAAIKAGRTFATNGPLLVLHARRARDRRRDRAARRRPRRWRRR